MPCVCPRIHCVPSAVGCPALLPVLAASMSILPAPVTMPTTGHKFRSSSVELRSGPPSPMSPTFQQRQTHLMLADLALPPRAAHPSSESQDFHWYSSNRPPRRPLSLPTASDGGSDYRPTPQTIIPGLPGTNGANNASVDRAIIVSLAQRVEELSAMVIKMEQERTSRDSSENILRRDIHILHEQKDSLNRQIASLEEVLRNSSKRLNDCVDASTVAMDTERELRREVEARARRVEDRVNTVLEENARLIQTKGALERELARVANEARAWRDKVRASQDMQEMAVATFAQLEALERENAELKQVMQTFAKGSTAAIVQQLQLVIERLEGEVAQHKKHEASSKGKGKENRLQREGTGVLEEMRVKTRAIQRRSKQLSGVLALRESTVTNNGCDLAITEPHCTTSHAQ